MLYPQKLFLLRGNHEWLQTSNGYQESFKRHLTNLYGDPDDVETLLDAFMSAFSFMSLACLLSQQRVLCVHGGIPRAFKQTVSDVLHYLNYVKKPVGGDFPNTNGNNVVTDLMWGDPADTDATHEASPPYLPEDFYRSPRDPANVAIACRFGKRALQDFLVRHRLQMVIRAHQNMATGCFVSNSRQLVTVFSSSRYDGENRAGALLIDGSELTVLAHAPDLGAAEPTPHATPITGALPDPVPEPGQDTDEDEDD